MKFCDVSIYDKPEKSVEKIMFAIGFRRNGNAGRYRNSTLHTVILLNK